MAAAPGGRRANRPALARCLQSLSVDADAAYLVFFVAGPVDDDLAEAVVARVRTCPGAGWFDDADAASPGERTTGGYVRVSDPETPDGRGLLDIARRLSGDHALLVEVQWREAVIGHLDRGVWRADG